MLDNNKGFTLIEIIAVLLILGVVTAYAVPRFIDVGESAELKVLEMAATELTSREVMEFSKDKSNGTDYVGNLDFDLGEHYKIIGKVRDRSNHKLVRFEYFGDPVVFKAFKASRRSLKRGLVANDQPLTWFLFKYKGKIVNKRR